MLHVSFLQRIVFLSIISSSVPKTYYKMQMSESTIFIVIFRVLKLDYVWEVQENS